MKFVLQFCFISFYPFLVTGDVLKNDDAPVLPNIHSTTRKLSHVHRSLNIQIDSRWKDRIDDIVQIPYSIDYNVFDSSHIDLIKQSLNDLQNGAKVIRFVERTTESSWISVVDTTGGCSSYVGKVFSGKSQDLNLARSGCMSKGIIQHEFLHAIGFQHEQTRTDRDWFVKINWDNIDPKHHHNFDIASGSSLLGGSYEYSSVMHYGQRAFALNPNVDTITPFTSGVTLGQYDGATEIDMREVQLLYQCITGARTLEDYENNLCTSDCKCWQGASGCNGDDDACQGNLICTDNICSINTGGGGTGGGSGTCGNGSIGDGVCADETCCSSSGWCGTTVDHCGTGTMQFTVYQNVESSDKCLDLAASDTSDGNSIQTYWCNNSPAQQWWLDDQGYIRSAVDNNKCITGSAGDIYEGVNLIINDCFDSDDRFIFYYNDEDRSFRPKLNNNLCIGPSRTEVNDDGIAFIELGYCSDFHQSWTPSSPSRRSLANENKALQNQECSDIPLGWYDSAGDNCMWYSEGTRCEDFGSTNKNFGKTANQACCKCGGGSNLNVGDKKGSKSNKKFIRDAALGGTCWDFDGWKDSAGYSCMWYSKDNHCSLYGDQFSTGGTSGNSNAHAACCACGGGLSSPPASNDMSKSPGCSDIPSNWLDVDGDSCSWYAQDDNCQKFGDRFFGMQNKTANEACCSCGGGFDPAKNDKPKKNKKKRKSKKEKDNVRTSTTNAGQGGNVPTDTTKSNLRKYVNP